MAASEEDSPPAQQPCRPCSGSGKVISNLGGERSEVPCPWCEGSGVFQREHDAQAARREARG
ncbi:MAG: hypothetical protein MSC31_09455 [Solirubrobacteraceae bacterium MAG38_C4-C5]|nr:hypothetical protein [Candidatus Siliceabacter maunaloa]